MAHNDLDDAALSSELHAAEFEQLTDAEYTLECPIRCPSCGKKISSVRAVRLLRSQVNFTSTLPRRGRIVVCPQCMTALPAELTNL
jgi:hypothetical protein